MKRKEQQPPQQSQQFDESDGSSAAPTASKARYNKSSSGGDDKLNVDDPVPALFKKFPGKKWIDLINDPQGRKYLEYWAIKGTHPEYKSKAQQALDYAAVVTNFEGAA